MEHNELWGGMDYLILEASPLAIRRAPARSGCPPTRRAKTLVLNSGRAFVKKNETNQQTYRAARRAKAARPRANGGLTRLCVQAGKAWFCRRKPLFFTADDTPVWLCPVEPADWEEWPDIPASAAVIALWESPNGFVLSKALDKAEADRWREDAARAGK